MEKKLNTHIIKKIFVQQQFNKECTQNCITYYDIMYMYYILRRTEINRIVLKRILTTKLNAKNILCTSLIFKHFESVLYEEVLVHDYAKQYPI